MLIKYLDELRNDTTKEEFTAILKMTEEDIKFNKVKFNKVTSANEFIVICNRSLKLVRRYY